MTLKLNDKLTLDLPKLIAFENALRIPNEAPISATEMLKVQNIHVSSISPVEGFTYFLETSLEFFDVPLLLILKHIHINFEVVKRVDEEAMLAQVKAYRLNIGQFILRYKDAAESLSRDLVKGKDHASTKPLIKLAFELLPRDWSSCLITKDSFTEGKKNVEYVINDVALMIKNPKISRFADFTDSDFQVYGDINDMTEEVQIRLAINDEEIFNFLINWKASMQESIEVGSKKTFDDCVAPFFQTIWNQKHSTEENQDIRALITSLDVQKNVREQDLQLNVADNKSEIASAKVLQFQQVDQIQQKTNKNNEDFCDYQDVSIFFQDMDHHMQRLKQYKRMIKPSLTEKKMESIKNQILQTSSIIIPNELQNFMQSNFLLELLESYFKPSDLSLTKDQRLNSITAKLTFVEQTLIKAIGNKEDAMTLQEKLIFASILAYFSISCLHKFPIDGKIAFDLSACRQNKLYDFVIKCLNYLDPPQEYLLDQLDGHALRDLILLTLVHQGENEMKVFNEKIASSKDKDQYIDQLVDARTQYLRISSYSLRNQRDQIKAIITEFTSDDLGKLYNSIKFIVIALKIKLLEYLITTQSKIQDSRIRTNDNQQLDTECSKTVTELENSIFEAQRQSSYYDQHDERAYQQKDIPIGQLIMDVIDQKLIDQLKELQEKREQAFINHKTHQTDNYVEMPFKIEPLQIYDYPIADLYLFRMIRLRKYQLEGSLAKTLGPDCLSQQNFQEDGCICFPCRSRYQLEKKFTENLKYRSNGNDFYPTRSFQREQYAYPKTQNQSDFFFVDSAMWLFNSLMGRTVYTERSVFISLATLAYDLFSTAQELAFDLYKPLKCNDLLSLEKISKYMLFDFDTFEPKKLTLIDMICGDAMKKDMTFLNIKSQRTLLQNYFKANDQFAIVQILFERNGLERIHGIIQKKQSSYVYLSPLRSRFEQDNYHDDRSLLRQLGYRPRSQQFNVWSISFYKVEKCKPEIDFDPLYGTHSTILKLRNTLLSYFSKQFIIILMIYRFKTSDVELCYNFIKNTGIQGIVAYNNSITYQTKAQTSWISDKDQLYDVKNAAKSLISLDQLKLMLQPSNSVKIQLCEKMTVMHSQISYFVAKKKDNDKIREVKILTDKMIALLSSEMSQLSDWFAKLINQYLCIMMENEEQLSKTIEKIARRFCQRVRPRDQLTDFKVFKNLKNRFYIRKENLSDSDYASDDDVNHRNETYQSIAKHNPLASQNVTSYQKIPKTLAIINNDLIWRYKKVADMLQHGDVQLLMIKKRVKLNYPATFRQEFMIRNSRSDLVPNAFKSIPTYDKFTNEFLEQKPKKVLFKDILSDDEDNNEELKAGQSTIQRQSTQKRTSIQRESKSLSQNTQAKRQKTDAMGRQSCYEVEDIAMAENDQPVQNQLSSSLSQGAILQQNNALTQPNVKKQTVRKSRGPRKKPQQNSNQMVDSEQSGLLNQQMSQRNSANSQLSNQIVQNDQLLTQSPAQSNEYLRFLEYQQYLSEQSRTTSPLSYQNPNLTQQRAKTQANSPGILAQYQVTNVQQNSNISTPQSKQTYKSQEQLQLPSQQDVSQMFEMMKGIMQHMSAYNSQYQQISQLQQNQPSTDANTGKKSRSKAKKK